MGWCRSVLCLAILSVLAAPAVARGAESKLTVDSPRDMQVFQRRTAESGPVVISGKLPANAQSVRYRVVGKPRAAQLDGAWQPIEAGADRTFRVEHDLPAGGWYEMEIEALRDGKPVASAKVAKFGVGEVFVTAGQSNSTSCAQFKSKQASGMVASFDGKNWALAEDPMPGAHDLAIKGVVFRGGSPWLAFGDAMYAKYQVPIGVAVTGFGGTSVNQWQPTGAKEKSGSLFGWMMARIKALGPHGFRAVLWHQGESDVKMKSKDYADKLTRVIKASQEQAGWEFPWFVAKVSYHNPKNPRFETTRAAQQKLWDTGVALEGPDTDTLTGADRDHDGKGVHLSLSGLKKHGQMWAERVGAYLDKQLNADKGAGGPSNPPLPSRA